MFTQKLDVTQSCSFTIYPGADASAVSIHDTIPAEWEVLSAVTEVNDDGCDVESANKGAG